MGLVKFDFSDVEPKVKLGIIMDAIEVHSGQQGKVLGLKGVVGESQRGEWDGSLSC